MISVKMCRHLPRCAAAVVLTFLLNLPAPVLAQRQSAQDEPLPQVTRAYAIENARIVVAPGREIARGTVVVRNGLIEAVGNNVRIPSDAKRIAGDSLIVYPGFIDGLSMAGIPKPTDENNRERAERPGEPSYERAGIQPQRRASSMISPGDDSIAELRRAGFTAAHVVPHGGFMPGSGAIIMLGGDDARSMILDGDASLLMQFEGAQGVYPATDMAVMARLRQLYREAERRARVEQIYEDDPRGIERPPADEVIAALHPAIRGDKPVVFYTSGNSGALQIHRAIELQRELGFQMILAGANQAFEAVEPLREAGHPVMLTLAFPDEPKAERDSTRAPEDTTSVVTPEPPSSHFVSDLRTHSYVDVPSERENLILRQQMERERYLQAASELHSAGVVLAFSTRDVKPADIHKNLRMMVEQGLPRDAALAALTTNPASVLGMERHVGTIEEGKIANLVLTNGPLFEEDTAIRFVFVDGIEYEIGERPQQERRREDREEDPAGEWAYTAATPDEETTGVLAVRRTGSGYTGTITIDARAGTIDLDEPSFDGRALSLTFTPPNAGTFTIEATLDGSTFRGSFVTPEQDVFPVQGRRMFGPSTR